MPFLVKLFIYILSCSLWLCLCGGTVRFPVGLTECRAGRSIQQQVMVSRDVMKSQTRESSSSPTCLQPERQKYANFLVICKKILSMHQALTYGFPQCIALSNYIMCPNPNEQD